MPELPEVETIVRGLRDGVNGNPSILHFYIRDAQLLWDKSLAMPTKAEFLARMAGQNITSINRRAKFLVFQLSEEWLLIHLRMSGDLRFEMDWPESGEKLLKHDRLVIRFANGHALVFNDPRKFGRLWLTQTPQDILGHLGFEPLDQSITGVVFYQKIHPSRKQIKPLLMDQALVAGLGNIYTDESLFKAQIHPCTPAGTLSPEQADRLLQSIRAVLNEGIKRNGASIDWVYRGGDFQNTFKVYQRNGQPCYRCGETIQRILVGQRGTHFCPHCQPAPILL